MNPHSFFVLPVLDMALFVVFFAGAIRCRRRPPEHKTLMLSAGDAEREAWGAGADAFLRKPEDVREAGGGRHPPVG